LHCRLWWGEVKKERLQAGERKSVGGKRKGHSKKKIIARVFTLKKGTPNSVVGGDLAAGAETKKSGKSDVSQPTMNCRVQRFWDCPGGTYEISQQCLRKEHVELKVLVWGRPKKGPGGEKGWGVECIQG